MQNTSRLGPLTNTSGLARARIGAIGAADGWYTNVHIIRFPLFDVDNLDTGNLVEYNSSSDSLVVTYPTN